MFKVHYYKRGEIIHFRVSLPGIGRIRETTHCSQQSDAELVVSNRIRELIEAKAQPNDTPLATLVAKYLEISQATKKSFGNERDYLRVAMSYFG